MSKYRSNARFAGIMYLLAMAGSLIGGIIIETGGNSNFIIIGVILELINAMAVIGIVAAFWTPLKKHCPSITAGYMGLRILESSACVAAAFIPAVLLNLDGDAMILTAVRNTITAYVVPTFFGVGGTLLYAMLYKLRLVPRYISIWGFAASIGVLFVMFVPVSLIKPVFGLPIIINEIYLGIYLIAKGFANKKDEENE